jgi:hypothetical protein
VLTAQLIKMRIGCALGKPLDAINHSGKTISIATGFHIEHARHASNLAGVAVVTLPAVVISLMTVAPVVRMSP